MKEQCVYPEINALKQHDTDKAMVNVGIPYLSAVWVCQKRLISWLQLKSKENQNY